MTVQQLSEMISDLERKAKEHADAMSMHGKEKRQIEKRIADLRKDFVAEMSKPAKK